MSTTTIERAGDGAAPAHPVARRKLLFSVPALAVAGLSVAFALGLLRDPRQLPSALIGKRVPDFDLPPVRGRALGLAARDLFGEPSLVNVFASWCVACRAEHPLLMKVKASGVVLVHGLNYKDRPEDAAAWLDTLGDPYTRTGADRDGRVAIDWGVYGVPETFVVSADGRIVHRHVGPMTARDLEQTILPMIAELRAGGSARSIE